MSFSPKAIYNWYRNTLRNPKYRWWIILGTIAYLAFPFDISPDFFPIVGQLDDLMIASLLVAELSQMALSFFKEQQMKTEDNTADNTSATVDIPSISVDEA